MQLVRLNMETLWKLYNNGGNSMISNQILQNTLDGLKTITRIDLSVVDMEGKTLATTFSQPRDLSLIHI